MIRNKNIETRIAVQDYFRLTKPKIVVLLAITGMVGYLLADTAAISGFDLAVYLLIGYLTAGGAMTINNAIDYDIDKVMERTRTRVSTGMISRLHVTIFGSIMLVSGLAVGYYYFGIYTTSYLAWGGLFYIFAYSLYLKRNSWLNTIIGGLASPAPVWGGYAARYEIMGVSHPDLIAGVPLEGWLLGILVFIWTPTHTFAMVVKNYEDYTRAKIPMLPVIVGIQNTSIINMIGGSITILYALVFTFLFQVQALFPITAISVIFFYFLVRFLKQPTIDEGTRNFHAHNIWLALVFLILLF